VHENDISKIIVDITFLIYKRLVLGLLESVEE
jgi:hypothetical protein